MKENDLNPVWLLESPSYQYENFKNIIDYTGYDVFCLYPGNICTRKTKGLFDLSGNPVDPKLLTDKYSVILKTGSNLLPKQIDVLSIAKTRKMIQMAHSILGVAIDVVAAIPLTNHKTLYGLYPEVWMNISCANARYNKLVTKNKADHVLSTKTHPYMTKVLEPLHSDIEDGTLGLLLSNSGGVGSFAKKVATGLKNGNKHYKKILVKRHPLISSTSGQSFRVLEEYCDEIEFIDSSSDKNKFFDRCSVIVTGMSSTFVEATLRNKHYNRSQKIYGINESTRFGMTDYPFDGTGIIFSDWTKQDDYKACEQYDDLLKITSEKEINKSYLESINEMILKINTKNEMKEW